MVSETAIYILFGVLMIIGFLNGLINIRLCTAIRDQRDKLDKKLDELQEMFTKYQLTTEEQDRLRYGSLDNKLRDIKACVNNLDEKTVVLLNTLELHICNKIDEVVKPHIEKPDKPDPVFRVISRDDDMTVKDLKATVYITKTGNQDRNLTKDGVKAQLLDDLRKQLIPYVDFDSEYDFHGDLFIYKARLRVLSPTVEEEENGYAE